MKPIFHIYGVFKKERCVYVGATRHPSEREQSHKSRFGKQIRFVIFKKTNSRNKALKLETQYIVQFRKEGQAQFNLNGFPKPKEKLGTVQLPLSLLWELRLLAATKGPLLVHHYIAKVLRRHVNRYALFGEPK